MSPFLSFFFFFGLAKWRIYSIQRDREMGLYLLSLLLFTVAIYGQRTVNIDSFGNLVNMKPNILMMMTCRILTFPNEVKLSKCVLIFFVIFYRFFCNFVINKRQQCNLIQVYVVSFLLSFSLVFLRKSVFHVSVRIDVVKLLSKTTMFLWVFMYLHVSFYINISFF